MALIRTLNNIKPEIGNDCFLAENSVIVGDVTMGDQCSVWYNAVIRGDVNKIVIGDRTNIQDGAVIHCTYQTADTRIGNDVSIGHNAIVHGCILHDRVLVGMGAIVMDNAEINSDSIVAAGAVVLEGTIVESGSVYAGVPAKRVKDVEDQLKDVFLRTSRNYIMYAGWYKNQNG